MQSITLADELTLREAPDGGRGDGGLPGRRGRRSATSRRGAAPRSAPRPAGTRPRSWSCASTSASPSPPGSAAAPGDAAAALRLAAAASGLGDERCCSSSRAALGSDVPAQVAPGALAGARRRRAGAAAARAAEPFGVLVLPSPRASRRRPSTRRPTASARARGAGELEELARRARRELADGAALRGLLVNDLEDAARALCRAIDARSRARARRRRRSRWSAARGRR